ncbi:hypothetical protein LOK49_LG07G00015 [Camellia lanceoleosa]|uniref:Uncharacterized protein n=1 Tax=Camellia lanceoleosa TaxID=1840588 RepID=A0ACC0H3L9_9ERIC|nr:hypothetical protein LOK49_LG07G00015 [Camellia lanceoleosa]
MWMLNVIWDDGGSVVVTVIPIETVKNVLVLKEGALAVVLVVVSILELEVLHERPVMVSVDLGELLVAALKDLRASEERGPRQG